GIAITDHNTVLAHKEIIALGKKHNILVIPGIEVKAKEGDILAYNVSKSFPKKIPAKKLVELMHKESALVAAAHPYSLVLHPLCIRSLTEKLDLDAVEIFNSRTYYSNKKAKRVAEARGLPAIAGSDAHMPEEVGNAYTIVDAKAKTVKAVLEAVKSGKTEVYGNTLPVWKAVQWYLRRVVRFFRNRFA
ncbi:MAG: PHP domain-containing protein, partial [Candidatus Aenigmarchaeota archaeon]|nr:PHP domain-containing protein [Candidatus Aenigmarchaeota archaeon]